MSAEGFEVLRQHMLAEICAGIFHVSGLIGKAALDERVMTAMGKVPRHEFVPVELQPYAYANIPLPIGFDKTISQPFIVALMTDLLDISADDTLLRLNVYSLSLKNSTGYGRIPKNCHSRYVRRDLFEQFQPFRTDAEFELGKTGGVAARLSQARNKARSDRIRSRRKHDWHGASPLRGATISSASNTFRQRLRCSSLGLR